MGTRSCTGTSTLLRPARLMSPSRAGMGVMIGASPRRRALSTIIVTSRLRDRSEKFCRERTRRPLRSGRTSILWASSSPFHLGVKPIQ